MLNEKWTPKLKKWLEEGKENAKDILDIPWDILLDERETADYIKATHPSVPFEIDIYVGREFVSLYIDTKYPTDVMDTTAKMRLYKKLLNMNRSFNMLKTTLMGDEDSVVVCADLDLTSLGKKEFSNALNALLIGGTEVVKILGIGDEIFDYMMSRTMATISDMAKHGQSKEDILNYLVNRVGVSAEMANLFFDEASKKAEPKPGEDPTKKYIG